MLLGGAEVPIPFAPIKPCIRALIMEILQKIFVPFLYKTEIYSLARVTKIKNMVKDGAYNYITSLYLTCVYK